MESKLCLPGWFLVFCMLGLVFFFTKPCLANDASLSIIENIGLRLDSKVNISEPQLKDLTVDEPILELESLIDPAPGSIEETLQLVMAFGIVERENFWLGCKLEK